MYQLTKPVTGIPLASWPNNLSQPHCLRVKFIQKEISSQSDGFRFKNFPWAQWAFKMSQAKSSFLNKICEPKQNILLLTGLWACCWKKQIFRPIYSKIFMGLIEIRYEIFHNYQISSREPQVIGRSWIRLSVQMNALILGKSSLHMSEKTFTNFKVLFVKKKINMWNQINCMNTHKVKYTKSWNLVRLNKAEIDVETENTNKGFIFELFLLLSQYTYIICKLASKIKKTKKIITLSTFASSAAARWIVSAVSWRFTVVVGAHHQWPFSHHPHFIFCHICIYVTS